MITSNPKSKDVKAVENKINSIFEQCFNNKTFEALANEYSEIENLLRWRNWLDISADNFYPMTKLSFL